jgi:hypothetical protein
VAYSVDDARASLSRYIHFYNGHRPHSNLDGRTSMPSRRGRASRPSVSSI